MRLTPHGVSGLKLHREGPRQLIEQSHPAWGEWIEIRHGVQHLVYRPGLTPHGVSGLKSQGTSNNNGLTSLTPHGVSGLK